MHGFTCKNCKKPFSSVAKERKFCGTQCAATGEFNPRWKGGRLLRPIGYIVVYVPNHANPSENGSHVLEHRLVMERHLGRTLRPDEIVHHKNYIKTDNRLENLEVMTKAEHTRHHFAGRKNPFSAKRKRNTLGQFVSGGSYGK